MSPTNQYMHISNNVSSLSKYLSKGWCSCETGLIKNGTFVIRRLLNRPTQPVNGSNNLSGEKSNVVQNYIQITAYTLYSVTIVLL